MAAVSEQPRVRRLLARGFEELDPTAARSILQIKFSKSEQDRVHQLTTRAKKSRLSREERSELEGYLQLGSLLTMLHSRARMALKREPVRPRRKSA